jgi:hypothetical protein
MGGVFGKETVKEPAFDVLLSRTGVDTPYDIRQYGKRFAIETEYTPNKDGTKASDSDGDRKSPFFALAGYIGVMGDAQNEGSTKMAMTAPVVMENTSSPEKKETKGEKIAMTAPVAMSSGGGDTKKMQFILPAEYDSMDKIPKPTNPNVHVKELEPSVGVVHRYSGFFNDKINTEKAKELAAQLKADGLVSLSEESVVEQFQFWGYNPPYTIPMFRRNEVWLELKDADAQELISKFGPPSSEDKQEATEETK